MREGKTKVGRNENEKYEISGMILVLEKENYLAKLY